MTEEEKKAKEEEDRKKAENDGDDDDDDLEEDDDADGEGGDADSDDLDSDEEESGDDEGDDDESDEDDEESSQPVSVEKHQQTVAQKNHFRDKAKRLAEENAQLKKDLDAKKPTQKKPVSKEARSTSSTERTDFRFDHPELKSSTVDQIEAYARSKGISLRESVKDPVVKILIRKAQKRSENANSSTAPSHRSQPTKRQKDWSQASKDELEKEASRRREAARNT